MGGRHVRTITMLRHPSLAVALFLTASCELAGAPPPVTPAKPVVPTAEVTPTPAPAPADMPREFMTRGGPSWGKERPRFKAKAAPPAPAATTSDTPPKATTP